MVRDAELAARALRVELQPFGFGDAGDFEAAFVAMAADRAGAVIVLPDTTTFVHRKRLAELALRHRLPTLFTHLESAADGGLMAFATNLDDLFYRAASYIDRLMKGAKAGDLPIEQPPPSLLLRADQVIQ
jgi:putative tryptophan/tyrosine transport system substrate-binding protein